MNGLQDQLEFGDDGWAGHQEKGWTLEVERKIG